MAEGDKIKYSDLIQPDDSFEKIIKQLEELNSSYGVTVNAIRAGATKIVTALKNVSGATVEGRKAINDAAESAVKLKTAHDAVAGSYDKINADLKDSIELWKSLSAEERNNANFGKQLASEIKDLKAQLTELNAQLKIQVPIMTEVEKAQKKLTYVQSDEFKELLRLKQEIANVIKARKQELSGVSTLEKAQKKLTDAQSEANVTLKTLAIQTKQANKEAELTARVNATQKGSYDNLAATYELLKFKLNAMGTAQRQAGGEAGELEKRLKDVYQQMSLLQKQTGKHTLDVGNYGKVWSGVGFSVQQVVRELPTLAQGSLIFFRAIANNIPILIDDIQRLRAENKVAIAQGKPTTSVIKQIVSSLFSWQSAIVVGLTLLASHGDKVVEWAKDLISGKEAATSMADMLKALNEELGKGAHTYGDNVVKLNELREGYSRLKTDLEKRAFIKEHNSELEAMGLYVDNVNEADLLFVDQTDAVIKALALRAKAAAASNVAAKKYTEAFQKQVEIEQALAEGPSWWDRVKSRFFGYSFTEQKLGQKPGSLSQAKSIAGTAEDKDILEEEAKAFDDLAEKLRKEMADVLGSLNIRTTLKTPKGRQAGGDADLTERIYKMRLDMAKKYEASQTELEINEFEKRKKTAQDKYNAEVRALRDKQRLLNKYLNDEEDRYEELSEEEKRIAINTYEKITNTIANYEEKRTRDLEKIETEKQIKLLEIQNTGLNWRIQASIAGTEAEYELQKRALENQKKIALLQNSLLPPEQRQDESAIRNAFSAKEGALYSNYSLTKLDQQQAVAKAEFKLTEATEKEKSKFILNQEKDRLNKQIALAEAGSLKWTKEQIDAAKLAVQGIDKEPSDLDNIILQIGKKGLGNTLLESLGFNEKAISAVNSFSDIIIDNITAIMEAEIEAAEKAVELAEERVAAAQKAYDAEVEARNNGYANNVATAKKELDQEKKNQRQKQKMLEDAQRRQEAVDTITQASSLITASANIWSSFSKLGPFGPALAAAAIATMWGSFTAAKIKARQVTAQTEEYGEGGLEILDGGSHASGNDIDLGVNNRRNRRMKAEGGEALAIINRKNTKRYKKILPEVIDSLNKGVFEDRYLNAFSASENANVIVNNTSSLDLSKIERDVQAIKSQNEMRFFVTPEGHTVIIHKNIKRIIKN